MADLKNWEKNTLNKKNPPPLMGGAGGGGCQKWKNPSFYEINRTKNIDQIFKNMTFLKTRDKTASNEKNHPPSFLWGELGGGG